MSTARFASAQGTLSVRRETLLKCVQFCVRTKEIRVERFAIVHYIHILSRYNAFSTFKYILLFIGLCFFPTTHTKSDELLYNLKFFQSH